jgi:hypothetical protein
MIGFSAGPPKNVEPGNYLCQMDRWGWAGRAIRDSVRLSIGTVWGALAVSISTAITLYVTSQVKSDHSIVWGSIKTVLGIIAGLLIGLAILSFYSFLPLGRNRHWKFSPETIPLDRNTHSLLVFRSRCFHSVDDVEFTVTDPKGKVWTSKLNSSWGYPFVTKPGDPLLASYPVDFKAPWPTPGTYVVSFSSMANDGEKRITFCTKKWKFADVKLGRHLLPPSISWPSISKIESLCSSANENRPGPIDRGGNFSYEFEPKAPS